MEDLEMLCQQIMLARRLEVLLGTKDVALHPDELKKFLRKEYEKYCAKLSEDNLLSLEEADIANDAKAKLQSLYDEALLRIGRFQFALPGYEREIPQIVKRKAFVVGENRYYRGDALYESDSYTIFQGYLEGERMNLGEVHIKLAKNNLDNRLLQNELRILETLHAANVPQWKHLPLVMDRFMAADKVGLIFRKTSGVSFDVVRSLPAYQNGVDRRDVIWMFDRVLSLLGYVHRLGIVHGNLQPETLIIQPDYHNVFVTDWRKAISNPAESGEITEGPFNKFSAPEVKSGGKIGPWSDLYSLGKITIWLLGGDASQNQIPESVEKPFADLLLKLVDESEFRRPFDAWEVHDEQNRFKCDLWGRKFRHFAI